MKTATELSRCWMESFHHWW